MPMEWDKVHLNASAGFTPVYTERRHIYTPMFNGAYSQINVVQDFSLAFFEDNKQTTQIATSAPLSDNVLNSVIIQNSGNGSDFRKAFNLLLGIVGNVQT